MNDTAVVVVSSHRARAKLERIIGQSHGYYNVEAIGRDGNDYHIVPIDKLDEILKIKSIRLSKRPPKTLAQRWTSW